MPIRKHIVQGDEVRLVVLPRFNAAALDAWEAFCASEDVFGLDVESSAPPSFEGARKLFGPAVALKTYTVPSDVSSSYIKRGFTPGSKHEVIVRMIQFGNKTEAWCFDAADPQWRPYIEALLLDESKRLVSHNAA